LSCSNNCPQKLILDNANTGLKATGNTTYKLEKIILFICRIKPESGEKSVSVP